MAIAEMIRDYELAMMWRKENTCAVLAVMCPDYGKQYDGFSKT